MTCQVNADGKHIPHPSSSQYMGSGYCTWCNICCIISANENFQVAKEDAVDLENPPNTKLFDPNYCNDPDTTLLLRHCHGLVDADQNAPATPTIVIQNDFEGLAGLLLQHNAAPPASAPNSAQSAPRMTQVALAFVHKMTLADFCEMFDQKKPTPKKYTHHLCLYPCIIWVILNHSNL